MSNYGHPYEPYDEQTKFMDDLSRTLSSKKIGIYESPTGTGKTLSLLCPSVHWLRSKSRRQLDADLAKIDADGGPEWLVSQAKQARIAQFDNLISLQKELIDKAQKERQKSMEKVAPPPPHKRVKPNKPNANANDSDISQFVLENNTSESVISSILSDYDSQFNIDNDDQSDAYLDPLKPQEKLVFSSRTHSQLSQVADSLAKLKLDVPVRYVTLGSRKQLCIHKEVQSQPTLLEMNEKCAELQRNKKCEFRHQSNKVRDQSLGQIMDIEDLAEFGKQKNACPYYGSRDAVPYSEVIGIPYPLLVMKKNREALKLSLENTVVIIDEAHNINDTVSNLNSCVISEVTVNKAIRGLQLYMQRVSSKLSIKNKRKVQQVILLSEALQTYFQNLDSKNVKPGTQVDPQDLFAKGNTDLLDLDDLSEFVYTSKLVYKVDSYVAFLEKQQNENQTSLNRRHSSNLGNLVDFMLIATDPLSIGKLYLDTETANQQKTVCLKYLLLDPSLAFEELVSECDTLVLAGGTMEPTTEFTNFLVPQIPPHDVDIKSYNHIIPKSQILAMCLSNLSITFANRSKPETLTQLGNYLLDIVNNVDHGVVAFFPGYAYLQEVVAFWQKSGVWTKLMARKKCFYETNTTKNKEDVFSAYAKVVKDRPEGALLLAVVGGRLSEGINFSDDLARAVVMIGLPFPNAFSAEMLSKRDFIEQKALAAGKTASEAKESARLFYENVAMRAVNQSVGRAIRHVNDYAAIYLIDERYKSPRIKSKLSKWIRDAICVNDDFVLETKNFFKTNATKK